MPQLEKEIIHILPTNDLKPHADKGKYCKCEPSIEEDEYGVVILHNSYDGREFFENEPLNYL
jgi:hypothetical protein